jgi:hypothetical protein
MEPLVASGQDLPESISWWAFVVLEVAVPNARSMLIRRHDDSPLIVGSSIKDSLMSS